MDKVAVIINAINEFLKNSGKGYVTAVEAAAYLDKKGILKDSESKAGKPLRELLRRGKIPHAFQDGVHWKIPHSGSGKKVVVTPVVDAKKINQTYVSGGGDGHKLELLADLVSKLLQAEYGIKPSYTIEYSPDWLKTIPTKSELHNYWPIIKNVYAALVDGKFDLDERLQLVKRNGNQQFDIWFHEPYSFAVEFDESQHFNQFRAVTLGFYNKFPNKVDLKAYVAHNALTKKPGTSGFQKLTSPDPLFPEMYEGDKQDNRMRQRAFRDFLKDLLPVTNIMNSTIRIPFQVVNEKIKDFTNSDLELIKHYLTLNGFLQNINLTK